MNDTAIEPVMSGSTTAEHGESWTNYVVFSRASFEAAGHKVPIVPKRWDENFKMFFPDWDNMPDETRDAIHAIADVAIEASGLYRFSRGPGRAFAHDASCRIYTRFIVVSQSGGLDI